MFTDPTLKYTPWFKLICEKLLFEWWGNLDKLEEGGYLNRGEIVRMLE